MNTWRALRVDYHAPDLGPFIVGAVAPLAGELRSEFHISRILVRPHWLRGPHALLVMAVRDGQFEDEIYPRCAERLETWLGRYPSREQLDPAEYGRQSQVMARAEREVRPLEPLAADNAVSLCDYDWPAPMGLAELSDVRDIFQADIFAVASQLIELRLRNRAAFLIKTACLIAAIGSVAQDGRYGFWPTSMLAHSNGFLEARPAMRETFDKAVQRLSQPLAAEFRRYALASGRYGAGETCPLLSPWIAALRGLEARLVPIVAEHRDRLGGHDVYAAGAFAELDSAKLERIRRSGTDIDGTSELAPDVLVAMKEAIVGTTLHLRYRLMINFIYGVLPVVGLSPVERACLCHVIAHVSREYFPQDWDNVKENTRGLASRAMLGDVA